MCVCVQRLLGWGANGCSAVDTVCVCVQRLLGWGANGCSAVSVWPACADQVSLSLFQRQVVTKDNVKAVKQEIAFLVSLRVCKCVLM